MKSSILKGTYCLFLSLLLASPLYAQTSSVSIGTETIKDKAVLWLKANGNQGLLIPVVNRASFTGLNNSDEKGMLIFDPTDNKLYYWSGAAWVEAGGSGSTTLAGNVTGAASATQVTGLKNKALPATLPSSAQALVYNGTSWVFQSIADSPTLANGQIITGNGTTNVATALSGDATLNVGVITIANNAITSAKISDGAVTSADILDGTIASADILDGAVSSTDIANGTIAAAGLSAMGATLNQVMKFNGTTWVAANDDTGTGAALLSNGQLLTGNGTTNAATTLSGDATLNVGVITIANNAVTTAKIIDGAVTTAKILDGTVSSTDIANGTIAAADLSAMGATLNQVMKYNGTTWVADDDDTGTGAALLSNGQLLTGNGTTNTASTLSGDATLNVGVITIANNAVTTAKIIDGAVTTAKILDGTVSSTDIANGTIAAADLSAMGATLNQVMKYNGTTWVADDDDTGTGAALLSNGQLLTGNGTTNAASTLSGDATLNVGVITIANNAVTTAKIIDGAVTTAKILDGTVSSTDIANGTIAAADLSAMGATLNQVMKYNGTTWVADDDDTGTGAALLSNGQLLTGNGTTNAASTLSGDATLNVGVITIANNAVTTAKIIDGAVTTAKILDGTITSTDILDGTIATADILDGTVTSTDIANGTIAATDLSAMGATLNQVMKYNGTTWVAGDDNTGTVVPILTNGQILTGNGTVNSGTALSGDATLAGGVLTVTTGAINSAKISDGSITTADILDGTITDADIAGVAASKVSGLTTDVVPRSNGTGLVASGILSDGSHVGISGGYNVAYAFQVNSESNFEDAVYFNDDHGNSGDVLVSQAGSGPPIWADPASLSAGFSTLNTIPKGNGTGMVASLLFDNGTNVGIGTTTPAQKLDVNGSINMAAGSFLYLGGVRVAAHTLTSNTFFGRNAGLNSTGNHNTFFGFQTGMNNTSGLYNTFYARGAGDQNSTGSYNVFLGADAGFNMTTGGLNTFVGFNAGFDGVALTASTFLGNKAGENNATGSYNTFVGERAGNANISGEENVFVGRNTGVGNTSGSRITLLGHDTRTGADALDNATAIGADAVVTTNNSVVLGNAANVGIGTSSPTTRLHVVSPSNVAYVASFDRNTATGTEMIAFYRQGAFRGDITESGGTVSYNPFTGSHYGYSSQEFEAGTLVTMTGKNFRLSDDGEPVYEVISSTKANDPKLLGSYLHTRENTPGTDKQVKVIMAVGNGFMWIADNGEDVQTGDYLISSDVAGHAMKDRGEFEISYVIARAAEDVTWGNETTTINGVKHKRISVFYESFTKNYKAEKLETEVSKLRAEVDAMKESSKGKMNKMEQELNDLKKMMEAFRQN